MKNAGVHRYEGSDLECGILRQSGGFMKMWEVHQTGRNLEKCGIRGADAVESLENCLWACDKSFLDHDDVARPRAVPDPRSACHCHRVGTRTDTHTSCNTALYLGPSREHGNDSPLTISGL